MVVMATNALPIILSPFQDLTMMQTRWASILNPFLGSPINNANLLTGIKLINGTTVVNHLLSRQMQGWWIVDIDAAATVYRSAPFNAQTLTLISSAACTVNLGVF